jgi:dimethylhistidine N-methyltransferase
VTEGSDFKARRLARMRADVLAGLSRPQKAIPPKYFYDEAGSRLFEEICGLDEYYLTRVETAMMESCAGEMAAALGPKVLLIEYGSGSSTKTRVLLDHLLEPVGYVPVDISADFLKTVAVRLRAEHPGLDIRPLAADFTGPLEIPSFPVRESRRVVYFPGSTIGNFTRERARSLLAGMAGLVEPDGGVLIGVDLVKDVEILEAAYNDSRGVTDRFNLNLLARFNRELGADFDLEGFFHRAIYDSLEDRIEMHLVSLRDQEVAVAGRIFHFREGEYILTEYAHKYTSESFDGLAHEAGLAIDRTWTDPDRMFSVHLLKPTLTPPEGRAP